MSPKNMSMTGSKIALWLLVGAVLLALLAYAGALAWMYARQESLLFQPTRLDAAHRFDLPGVTEVRVPVAGAGAWLSALHYQQPDPRGVIFFLHGNAGDLSVWLTDTAFYRSVGYDVFMIDYRGYGKSGGRIESEAQLHADVRAAWDAVAPRYAGKKKVIYGRSLGAGLAAQLAARVPSDLLVLVTPFTSVLDVTRATYPWVPPVLLRYPLRTDLGVKQSQVPVLILHGERDELFSMDHALKLEALRPGVDLVRVPEAGHGDIHLFEAYTGSLKARLGTL
jgi:pimeloyl-ACP methyl ester carboxylesterase